MNHGCVALSTRSQSYRVDSRKVRQSRHGRRLSNIFLQLLPEDARKKRYKYKKGKKGKWRNGETGKRGRKNGSPEGYIQLIIDENCNSFHDVYVHTTFGTPSSKIEESRERDCGHEPRCWHPPSGLRIDTRTSAFCHFSERPHGPTQYNTHTHTQCVENRRKEKTSFIRRWRRSDIFIITALFFLRLLSIIKYYYYIVALDNSPCPPLCPRRSTMAGRRVRA